MTKPRPDQLADLIGELASCPAHYSVATWPGLECDSWSTLVGWRRRRDMEAALYSGGFCDECLAPSGHRTEQTSVAREFDGNGPVIGLGAGHYRAVAATARFLEYLTPIERALFDVRPVDISTTPAAESYMELIPRERPLAPSRMWVLGGPEVPCPRCGGIKSAQHVIRDRDNHWITSFIVIRASTIAEGSPDMLVAGTSSLNWQLLATRERLATLSPGPLSLSEPAAFVIPDNERFEIMAVCRK